MIKKISLGEEIENKFEEELKNRKIPYHRPIDELILGKGFKHPITKVKQKDWTYLPDFIVNKDGRTIIIEVKSYRPSSRIKMWAAKAEKYKHILFLSKEENFEFYIAYWNVKLKKFSLYRRNTKCFFQSIKLK